MDKLSNEDVVIRTDSHADTLLPKGRAAFLRSHLGAHAVHKWTPNCVHIGESFRVLEDDQMKRTQWVLAIGVAVMISGCAPPAASDTRAADEQAIRKLDAEWSATAGKKDVDGAVAYYADDAILLPPNAPAAKDKAAIKNMWRGLLSAASAISWTPERVEVAQSGDLAYLTGSYAMTIAGPDGKPLQDKGKMVEVWKKQADGKWKAVADMFSSDLPLPVVPKK